MPKIGSLVLQDRDQDFAGLRLAGRDRALDLRPLEQRRAAVDGDLQLAAGRVGDILGEGVEIFDVRIVVRIGARQIPFGLRRAAVAVSASSASERGQKLHSSRS